MPSVLRRPLIAALAAAAGLFAAGCGDKESVVTFAPDEGTYVQVGPLSYQVQISRYLTPGDTEDSEYLAGLPAGTQLDGKGFLWFGVFIRAKNYSDQTQVPAPRSAYSIKDTEGNTFHPIAQARKLNPYAYTPVKMTPAAWFPSQQTTAGINPIAGELLVFRLPVSAVQNRPLELHIDNGGHSAVISLDL
jgi:hypothetical protein